MGVLVPADLSGVAVMGPGTAAWKARVRLIDEQDRGEIYRRVLEHDSAFHSAHGQVHMLARMAVTVIVGMRRNPTGQAI
jgi:hypothetical protein